MSVKKYHLTDDGPKVCTANVRDCPVGGEHFANINDAQKQYETNMSQQELPKSISKTFTMNINNNTRNIINKLNEAGIRALIVGGSVRDQFLGLDNKDIDIELYGARENGDSLGYNDVKKLFDKKDGYKMDEAGASFSVLKVRKGKDDFDISLPRTEMSTGDKHTDYDVQHDSRMTFEEAASRRDFTINSMGYDAIGNKLIDPYNGATDLKNKTLRHISDAFSDDPLRCMRAVNFSSRFGFDVHPETVQLCNQLADSYSSLAHERVEEEFNKLFNKGDYCDKGLTVMHDIGWAQKMDAFKDVAREDLDKYGKLLNTTPKGLMRKAVLSHAMKSDNYKDPATFIESSKHGRAFINGMNELYSAIDNKDRGSIVAAHRKMIRSSEPTNNNDIKKTLNILGKNTEIFDTLPDTPVDSVVTGKKLLDLGYAPGPEMGKIIVKAQKIQDSESIYDFDQLLSRAMQEK